jgi:hypothetical protein
VFDLTLLQFREAFPEDSYSSLHTLLGIVPWLLLFEGLPIFNSNPELLLAAD